MIEHISAYVKNIDKRYQTGQTTEHSFRGDLQQLIQNCTGFVVINEQKRIDCGMPDLALYKHDIALAFIEAKDLNDGDLDGKKKNKEQFDRYKASLDTIIFTDYLDFHLYKEGELLTQVQLASIQNGHIVLNEDAVPRFISIIEHLLMTLPQKIASPAKLAKLMADKARIMAKAVELTLEQDTEKKGKLSNQLKAFQNVLNKDLDEKRFADLYAQTIAYGLFAARLHDNTSDKFTRIEAAELIPQTNPFLRQIFQHIAGFDIEESIKWIVEDLVNIFAATDVKKLRKNFGKEMQKRDPMIHFYEDFLQAYDPAAKKKYGVYYTPQPVVEFIVRAVDDILKADFGLEKGLADISKVDVKIRKMEDGKDVPTETVETRHRVQILDPATGTGTFLAEVVGRIKEQQQAGAWTKYVDEHLIPRIHGFEYMMAPYTIAHLKLDMLINWWGDQKLPATHKDRVQIYLTNSLDQTELTNKYTLAEMIAKEANEANNIKHNAPVMVVVGNPPYSGESKNTSEWIMKLMEDYKKEPNSNNRLNEKNPKWINNDYCKFIRMAQDYVERKGEGIVAYICANSFIDNPTFRGMRWHLLRSFDKIYIINLHGNAKPKPEKCLDGSKDENVFDIQVGTSINIFIKSAEKASSELAKIYYSDLYGLRDYKYAFLAQYALNEIEFAELVPVAPFYFFIPKNSEGEDEYKHGFKLDELCHTSSVGVVSAKDNILINQNVEKLQQLVTNYYSNYDAKYVKRILYRPFDLQNVYYDTSKIARPREKVMRHLTYDNFALIAKKGFPNSNPPIFISNAISEFRYWSCSGMQGGDFTFPLYLYPSESELGFEAERKPNLDESIWAAINVTVGHDTTPEDIFDYIYGVLHSPAYRAKYKEFLKVDFPRIPYPKDADEFEHFRSFGNQLRELHLMHNVPESSVSFPFPGNMQVDYLRWEWNMDDGYSGNVWINDAQCFEGIPADAWNFYIGGYQPAQKWLKDRKGRTLSFDDIEHYRRIISVLIETKRLMDEIDKE